MEQQQLPTPPAPDINQQTTPPQQPSAADPASRFLDPEEIIIEWNGPSRAYKKRNRQYYVTIGTIIFLVSLILFFAGQFLPIAVAISVGFLLYVQSAVPPTEVKNMFTTYGLHAGTSFYYWEELPRYWYSEKFHQKLLHFEVERFPNQITLVVEKTVEADVESFLSMLLPNQKPAPTTFDKAAQWLQQNIPLDTEA